MLTTPGLRDNSGQRRNLRESWGDPPKTCPRGAHEVRSTALCHANRLPRGNFCGRAIIEYDGAMQKNTVSHFEIYADDPDKLTKFYTSLFDWIVTPVPGMDYRTIHSAETD